MGPVYRKVIFNVKNK